MRPISMMLPAKPATLTDNTGTSTKDSLSDGGEITSFYLPKDTTKAIHITW